MTAENVIDVRGLTKRFGDKTVVDHFDIIVPRGAIYGFLGPNGSGKTTTIRMICGLLTPDEGEGTCLGFDVRRQAMRIKERVGYMTQKFSYYEDLSIRENLDFVARMYRLDRQRQRVDAALADLGLADRQGQLAGSLSGGWKQRLALAACLLHEPDLLLLDEPTAGVDPKARRDFWDEIRLLSAKGVTVLVSTHYMVGLVTYRVSGPEISALEAQLRQEDGIAQVARFGAVLHVSGTDRPKLEQVVERYRRRGTHEWVEKKSELEEAFIYLMTGARDNFARDAA